MGHQQQPPQPALLGTTIPFASTHILGEHTAKLLTPAQDLSCRLLLSCGTEGLTAQFLLGEPQGQKGAQAATSAATDSCLFPAPHLAQGAGANAVF